ncbi:hypothetical protein JTE90_018590, partial [Oedothorax gibbosus]
SPHPINPGPICARVRAPGYRRARRVDHEGSGPPAGVAGGNQPPMGKRDLLPGPNFCPRNRGEKGVCLLLFHTESGSTRSKGFLLNISGIPLNETASTNTTLMHLAANDALRRISPMYYPTTTVNRFYKILFVRHPFDR